MSFAILRHALMMIWDNRNIAMRIALPLIGFMVLANYITASLIPPVPAEPTDVTNPFAHMPSASAMLSFLLILALQLAISAYVIVRWHRYVLLPEASEAPPPPMDRVIAYIIKVVLIGLATVALTIVLSLIAALLGVFSVIVLVPGIIALYVVVLRLSLVLPASAIGAPLGFADAIKKTEGSSMMIAMLLLWSVLLALLVGVAIGLISLILPAIVLPLIQGALGGVSALVTASVLTTLYGMLIEGRELRQG